jgi:hypothetical protein
MKHLGRLVLWGFVSWAVTLSGSMCLFPLKQARLTLFDTLMGSVLSLSTVLCTLAYFRPIRRGYVREGIQLGMAFLACNILFDLPLFAAGPMQMAPADYLQDIGLAYLAMPVVSVGYGYGMSRAARAGDQSATE